MTIDVPDDSLIVEPKNLPGLENEEEAVRQALQAPIGTQPLRDMVKGTDKVAIVISDITRPTPNHKLV
ncbi:lactate racemase domain-containing protein, partial [Bacillus sp. SIMBA_074]|uniref:lactate racemase domain-containing protein n=1 Tax=Bacillus sp. SIMBA_074 TaxID=3085812 RepID=UPI00397BAA2C